MDSGGGKPEDAKLFKIDDEFEFLVSSFQEGKGCFWTDAPSFNYGIGVVWIWVWTNMWFAPKYPLH